MCYDLGNLVNLVASTCWNADVGPMLATVSTVLMILSGRRPLFGCFSFMNGSKSSRTQGSSRFFPISLRLDHWKVSIRSVDLLIFAAMWRVLL